MRLTNGNLWVLFLLHRTLHVVCTAFASLAFIALSSSFNFSSHWLMWLCWLGILVEKKMCAQCEQTHTHTHSLCAYVCAIQNYLLTCINLQICKHASVQMWASSSTSAQIECVYVCERVKWRWNKAIKANKHSNDWQQICTIDIIMFNCCMRLSPHTVSVFFFAYEPANECVNSAGVSVSHSHTAFVVFVCKGFGSGGWKPHVTCYTFIYFSLSFVYRIKLHLTIVVNILW